jgi:hypothetical protein
LKRRGEAGEQWEKLASEHPSLRGLLTDFLLRYEQLRLKLAQENSTTRKSTQMLFKTLRKILKKLEVK